MRVSIYSWHNKKIRIPRIQIRIASRVTSTHIRQEITSGFHKDIDSNTKSNAVRPVRVAKAKWLIEVHEDYTFIWVELLSFLHKLQATAVLLAICSGTPSSILERNLLWDI